MILRDSMDMWWLSWLYENTRICAHGMFLVAYALHMCLNCLYALCQSLRFRDVKLRYVHSVLSVFPVNFEMPKCSLKCDPWGVL